MTGYKRAKGVAALLLLFSACTSEPPAPEPVAPRRDDRRYAVDVNFGADANTLLLGTCPRRAPDKRDCRVELLDVARQRSVAFMAPAGFYLHQPSLAADGKNILAVATAVKEDKTGNRAAFIVRFSPKNSLDVEVVYNSGTGLALPLETESGLAFWTVLCAAPIDRYCDKEPMVRWRGEKEPHGLGRPYGFGSVGPIFLSGGKVFANAASPAGSEFEEYDVLNKEHTNIFVQLDAAFPRGWKKVPQRGLAGSVGVRDGKARLFLKGEDQGGSGLFVADGNSFRRFAGIPNAVIGGSTTNYVVDRLGTSSSMITLFNRRSEGVYTTLLLSTRNGAWKPVNLPPPASSATLGLIVG